MASGHKQQKGFRKYIYTKVAVRKKTIRQVSSNKLENVLGVIFSVKYFNA